MLQTTVGGDASEPWRRKLAENSARLRELRVTSIHAHDPARTFADATLLQFHSGLPAENARLNALVGELRAQLETSTRELELVRRQGEIKITLLHAAHDEACAARHDSERLLNEARDQLRLKALELDALEKQAQYNSSLQGASIAQLQNELTNTKAPAPRSETAHEIQLSLLRRELRWAEQWGASPPLQRRLAEVVGLGTLREWSDVSVLAHAGGGPSDAARSFERTGTPAANPAPG